MSEARKLPEGAALGRIRSSRIAGGGVRIEILSTMSRSRMDLGLEEAKRHAAAVLALCEPLSDTGAAAIAAERAAEGSHHE